MKKKISVLILLITLFIHGCTFRQNYHEIQEIVTSLEIESLIGQLLIIAVPSNRITPETIEILKKYKPGGVILYNYNLLNGSCSLFANQLQDVAMQYIHIPLFISIDQEGGIVQRITNGVTQFPGNYALGIVNDAAKTYNMAQILGIQLRLSGINMNLAPVLDVNSNSHNPIIHIRSFSCSPTVCAQLGKAYIKGLQKSRCIAVAKHFPGHGDTVQDSHYMLPVVNKTFDEIKQNELIPFNQAVKAGVECIMTAHIAFPKLECNNPATISSFFLTDILRRSWKFKGLIITDDLEMKGISEKLSYGEAAIASLKAGADVLLISSYKNHVQEIVDSIKCAIKTQRITRKEIINKVAKIIDLKVRYDIAKINNGIISKAEYTTSLEDLKLLQKADKLNAELSQKSIVFYSQDRKENFKEYVIDTKRSCVNLYSKNKVLIDIFDKENITKLSPIKSSDLKNIITLIDSSSYSINELKILLKNVNRSQRNKILLLITGNPFTILKHFKDYPMVMTFSNTYESIQQLAYCLKGLFTPKLLHECLDVK